MGPVGGGGGGESTRHKTTTCSFAVKLPRESYLKSHHSQLHSAKSSWLRLQALAVVKLGTLVITEVGQRIGMFIVISEVPAVSLPPSAVSVSVFTAKPRWPFSPDRLTLLMRNQSALAVRGRTCLKNYKPWVYRKGACRPFLFLLNLQGMHCLRLARHTPNCDFL